MNEMVFQKIRTLITGKTVRRDYVAYSLNELAIAEQNTKLDLTKYLISQVPFLNYREVINSALEKEKLDVFIELEQNKCSECLRPSGKYTICDNCYEYGQKLINKREG